MDKEESRLDEGDAIALRLSVGSALPSLLEPRLRAVSFARQTS